MAGRDPKPAPVSIGEWRRYVQRETRRLLQKQEERVARGDGDSPAVDPATGLPYPPEALHQPGLQANGPDVAHRAPTGDPADRLSGPGEVISRPAPRKIVQTAPTIRDTRAPGGYDPGAKSLGLNDLASLESDVRPLTPDVLAQIERERIQLAQSLPTQRMAPQDEAALLRQASTPLEAEEAAMAQAEVLQADVRLDRREAAVIRADGVEATQAKTGQPGTDQQELAVIATAIEVVADRPPATVEQTSLFDMTNLARREAEQQQAKPPSPKQKREDLIEELLDPVISLDEAATILNVCKTTVRRYTNQGLLECIRTPGNQRRFKLSTILNFVDVKDVKGIGKRGRKPKSRDASSTSS